LSTAPSAFFLRVLCVRLSEGLPLPQPLLHRELVLDGIRLSYLEREATGGAAPLLLLHGLIASAETFAALIAELPPDRRIIALDLPGTELPSHAKASDLTLCGLARLVLDFSKTIGLNAPIILGHSHGGAIALQIAASFPESIAGLILLCPAHPFVYRERWLIAFYNSWLGGAVARTFRWFPKPFQGVGFRRLLGPVGRKARVDFRPYRASLGNPATIGLVLRLIKTWNTDMDALGKQMETAPISVATLFVWGDCDPVVPIDTAPALQRCLTRWEQATLRGVGHLPNDEATGECGAHICTWLALLDQSDRV